MQETVTCEVSLLPELEDGVHWLTCGYDWAF